MKTLVCHEPGSLELILRPDLGDPQAGWVNLKVEYVGICGTDYHIYEGKQPFLQYPRVMGHEIAATVVKTGAGVDLAPGTAVIVNPYLACGSCHACAQAKPNCCMAIKVLGVHTDGAFCEEITVPATNIYPANDIPLQASACVEFLAIGAHAVRRSRTPEGANTLVIGAGPIGLGAALFSRIAGHKVTLLDASPERLAMARQLFGFEQAILASDATLEDIRTATGGNGFDTVFDATGHAGSMQQAFSFVAHGGSLVYVGLVKGELTFDDPEFHKREMTLFASRNALKADFDHVRACISDGSVEWQKLISHETTLEKAVTDLPVWARQRSGLIKAIIRVGS
jgi:2-desacetyl-2-hydroxyethyl bacteriochlorophyllide A dehydrogenase